MKIHDYIEQIEKMEFFPISESVWDIIQIEGLDEEKEKFNASDWLMANLKISSEDSTGLVKFDSNTINKFNEFDFLLKEKFNLKYIDLIDYEKGTIVIVKTKS